MSAAIAREAIGAALDCGVREFCVCAGARNGPLLAALGGVEGVRVYRFVVERSAGFFALGRTMVSGVAVAVIVTSGTAVPELYPAVVEAHYQGRPLLVISADREVSFRGSGAPQAIEQAGIFGDYVGSFCELGAGEAAPRPLHDWNRAVPAHLNVCLGEPSAEMLAEAGRELRPGGGTFVPRSRDDEAAASVLEEFLGDSRGLLVVVGSLEAESVEPVREFLGRLGAPVAAEAISGLGAPGGALEGLILRVPERSVPGHAWKKVLRLGGVPSGRFWRALEERPELEVFSVAPTGYPGLARPSRVVSPDPRIVRGMSGTIGESSAEREEIIRADRIAFEELEDLLRAYPRSEVGLIGWLSRVIPADAEIFLGNSLSIREWNLAAGSRERNGKCLANRGANGIDGELASF
ncbi:MAG: 2-succinyl-5-enolpyruvyl-6-hydroxy-3-cyclohexene-1-carboxylic-acid synthase, partial [Verrucomicrobiales bacterium]